MLLFLSNEIVAVSKEVVGDKILEDPLRVNPEIINSKTFWKFLFNNFTEFLSRLAS